MVVDDLKPNSYYISAEERYARLAMTRQEQIKNEQRLVQMAHKRHMEDNEKMAPLRRWRDDQKNKTHKNNNEE